MLSIKKLKNGKISVTKIIEDIEIKFFGVDFRSIYSFTGMFE